MNSIIVVILAFFGITHIQTAGHAESGRTMVEAAIDAGKLQVFQGDLWWTVRRGGETYYRGDCFMIPFVVGEQELGTLNCMAFEWETDGKTSWRGSTLKPGYRIVE